MEVLKYLETKPLDVLNEELGIKHKLYENGLCVLNYDQINSPKFNPIVKECRGLIIDTLSLRPVSRTFNRFFNLNEDPNDPFNPNRIKRIEEKADGSLMSVYWYDDQWHVASRGNAYAEGSTPYGKSFRDVFLEIIGISLNKFMANMPNEYSFTFEMCSIYNKVVKLYEIPVLYLLNAVEVNTGKEMDNELLDHYATVLSVKRPKTYDIHFDHIHTSFKDFPATEEGYVIIDDDNNRVKVKNPTYVELHHLKGNGEITPKRITNVIFNGELEEVINYFPEYREFFEPYQAAYDLMVDEINQIWDTISKIDEQKEFALTIKDLPYKSILFSMKKGLTFDEAIGKISTNGRLILLETLMNMNKGDYHGKPVL
jgi:hypothetical protein